MIKAEKYYKEHHIIIHDSLKAHKNCNDALKYKLITTEKIYQNAVKFLDPSFDNSEIKKTSKFYTDALHTEIKPLISGVFPTDSNDANAVSISNSVLNLVDGFPHIYEHKLAAEITKNAEYYQLYPLCYFQNMVDITFNKKICAWEILEKTLYDMIDELERDVNVKCCTFYNFAFKVYTEYASDIAVLLGYLAKRL